MVYCNVVFTSILVRSSILVFAAMGALAGCETLGPKPAPPASTISKPSAPQPSKEAASAKPPAVVEPVKPPVPELSGLKQASWRDLPDWQADNPSAAWEAFRASCRALVKHEAWRDVCTVAQSMADPERGAARRFFETSFTPFQLTNADGSEEGLITGYYEPLLRGARKPGGRYRFPVFGVPDDLLVLDLTEVYPELKGMRLRGRLEGRRVLPYFDRSQIEQGLAPLVGKEIAYVDDSIDLFFLQIQGSGRIALDSGETIRVSYADQNGHPYRSIGRILAERGDLPLEKASMQGIKAWAQANPDKLTELLNQNGSYVFFRELPADTAGPPGALGVPLTPRRSVAVDARYVPLGAPVYIATTWPLSNRPLNQLMLAQDTGGAIRGAVRADFFWGFGDDAGSEAGRMKQPLRMWVLLPKNYPLPQNARTK